MKLSKKQIREFISKTIKSYLLEAEEEPAKEEGGEEEVNPFAAADEKGDEKGGEEEEPAKDEKKPTEEKPAGIPVKFNVSAVKRYNDKSFVSDTGTVKSISKNGIVVTTQPDQVDVLVNFDDISESVNNFFKKKKK
jgi:hypothetical protein